MNRIMDGNFQLAEYAREEWAAKVDSSTTPQDLLNPDFWANVAHKLRPGAVISVYPATMDWHMTLFVRAAGKSQVAMGQLSFTKFAANAPDVADYEPRFSDASNSWSVVRTSDKLVMVDKLPTREAASNWIAQKRGTNVPKREKAAA